MKDKNSSTGSPDEQNRSSKADGINISKVVVSGGNLRVPEINITDAETLDICQQQETSMNWKIIDNKLLAHVSKVQDLDDMSFRPRLGSESMVSKMKNRARARTRKSEDTPTSVSIMLRPLTHNSETKAVIKVQTMLLCGIFENYS